MLIGKVGLIAALNNVIIALDVKFNLDFYNIGIGDFFFNLLGGVFGVITLIERLIRRFFAFDDAETSGILSAILDLIVVFKVELASN